MSIVVIIHKPLVSKAFRGTFFKALDNRVEIIRWPLCFPSASSFEDMPYHDPRPLAFDILRSISIRIVTRNDCVVKVFSIMEREGHCSKTGHGNPTYCECESGGP